MKRRKLAVRRSKVARKTRKNPSEYGIAPVIIAGLIGLASTLGGGLLSGRRAKKEREAQAELAAQEAEQKAQEAAKQRQMWYILGGVGAGTLLIVGLYALSKSGDKRS